MDRSLASVERTDVPPDLWRTLAATSTLSAFVWTGALEFMISADIEALRPRRLAIALWLGAALWIVAAWRQIGTRR